MEANISDKRWFFNAITLATSGKTVEQLDKGELGFFDTSTMQTVALSTNKALPNEIVIGVRTLNDDIIMGESFKKDNILNAIGKEYSEPVQNEWELTIDSCECIKNAIISIQVEESSVTAAKGQWSETNNIVEVSPSEFECYCDCTSKSTYENHMMTKMIYEKIMKLNSPYFTAEVHKSTGELLNGLTEIEQFIKTNKAIDTDDDKSNDAVKLKLVIKGKPLSVKPYQFGYADYATPYPTGVKLFVSGLVNENQPIICTEKTKLKFEVGYGAFLREDEAENICNMLGEYNTLEGDGRVNPEIASKLQFKDDVKYDTITFEYVKPKANVLHNINGMRKSLVVIGSNKDDRSTIYNKIKGVLNLI